MADNPRENPTSQAFMATIRATLGPDALKDIDPDKTISPNSTGCDPTMLIASRPGDIPTVRQTHSQADVPTIQHHSTGDTPTIKAGSPTVKSGTLGAVPILSSHTQENLARWSEYTIRDRVGKGGMGEIFLAGQNALQREVAIKKIIPEHLDSPGAHEMEQSFISEALVTGYLDHPNIVPVYALGRDNDGKWFFTMKMVRGIEWRHLLHPDKCKTDECRAQALARNLDIDDPARRVAHLEENVRILLSICNAVSFAHSKKIIHRDLKPENVMVGAFGEVLVMDWGLAVDVSDSPAQPGSPEHRVPSRTACGLGGTPSYMAPEQMTTDADGHYSGSDLNCWTDVFLLGGMLHELLTGITPYSGSSIGSVLVKVSQCDVPTLPESTPAELAAICRKAMAKNPRERFADALEFQRALSDFMRHRESAAVACKAEREAKGNDIPSLARAVVLYDQALELWPENKRAQNEVQIARTLLADKERKARATRHSLIAAVACIIIGLSIGFVWIRSEQNKAMLSMQEEKKAKNEAMNSMIAEKSAKEKAVAATHDESVSIARGLVTQGDAFLMANRFGPAKASYRKAWQKFDELHEPAIRAHWGLFDFYRSVDTPLLTLSDEELASGAGAVAISLDGKLALSSSPDNSLRLWDVTTGIPIASLRGHTNTPLCIGFSSSGKRAVSGGQENIVRVWNLDDAKQIRELPFPTQIIKWVSFADDDKQILAGGSDGATRIWNADSGELIRDIKRTDASPGMILSPPSTVAETFCPGTRRILTGTNFNATHLWNADTGKKVFEFNRNKDISAFTWGVGLSLDGKLGLSGGRDKIVHLWDLEKGALLRDFIGHNAAISSVAISEDKRLAVSGSWDQTMKLWDANSGALVADLIGHENKVLSVAMSADGRNILSRGFDRTLKQWDAKARTKVREFRAHTEGLECLCFSPDGSLALTAGRDNRIRIWDLESGVELRRMIGFAKCAAFLPDGKQVITGDNFNGVLQIWDIDSGLKSREIPAPFKCGTFSSDGKLAFLAGAGLMDFKNHDVKLWDTNTGTEVAAFDGATDSFYDASFSNVSRRGAAITINSVLMIWNLDTRQATHTIAGPFYRVAFSPDGRQLVTGNVNGDVELWDVETGSKIRDFRGHLDQIRSVAFSPDGKHIASGSDGKTVKLWDVASGMELREFKGHDNAIGCIAFDAASARILTGGDDKVVCLWDSTFATRYRDFEIALPKAQSTLAQNPNDPAALNVLGEWFAFRGVHDRAAIVLERARKNGAPVSALTLGRCYEKLRDYESAATNYDEELSRLRHSPIPVNLKSFDVRNANIMHLSICVRVLYARLIEVAKAKKDHAASMAALQKYLTIFEREVKSPALLADKLNEHAWRLLTDPNADYRDPKVALPLAQRAVELTHETDPSPLDVLALALFRNARRDEALVAIKKAVAILPANMSDAARKEYTDLLKEIESSK